MGILDKKVRIFDTILTPEGRAHLAKGKLKAQFYSFTDNAAVYLEDTIISASLSGSQTLDSTYRIMLEACGLPQDQITFKADDSGKLTAFPASGSERFVIHAGQIFSGSKDFQRLQITGSQFNSLAGILLSSSIDSFKKQYILKSPDPIDERNREFFINSNDLTFHITDDMPFKKNEINTAKVDHVESFFQDKRLSHLPNFKFLPPVNRAKTGSDERTLLGNYVNLNQAAIQSFDELEKELVEYESISINFTETSNENNLLCQFFETSEGTLKKLDIIDFGSFKTSNGGGNKHVFFVGKVFIDGFEQPTFINMFTLVFE